MLYGDKKNEKGSLSSWRLFNEKIGADLSAFECMCITVNGQIGRFIAKVHRGASYRPQLPTTNKNGTTMGGEAHAERGQ